MTDTATTTTTEAEVKPAIVKSQTRKIRSSVFAWLDTKNADQIKAITLDEFVAFVLGVDPSWPIAAKAAALPEKEGIKLLKSHKSWYQTNHKKRLAEAAKAQAVPPVEAPAAAQQVQAVA